MSSTLAQVEIAASPREVFDLVHDYERRLAWDPFLRRADVLGGAVEAGIGVKTLCVARWRSGGLGMETCYMSFQRPRVAAVEMTRGPWFLEKFAASILQQPMGHGGTRVTYKASFRARPRWAAPLLEPLFRLVFRYETRRRLECLKRFMESGPV